MMKTKSKTYTNNISAGSKLPGRKTKALKPSVSSTAHFDRNMPFWSVGDFYLHIALGILLILLMIVKHQTNILFYFTVDLLRNIVSL